MEVFGKDTDVTDNVFLMAEPSQKLIKNQLIHQCYGYTPRTNFKISFIGKKHKFLFIQNLW